MEAGQFDRLAHRVAARSNRRGLLGAFAGGSVLAAFGARGMAAAVGSPCVLDTTITIWLGANAGQLLWAGAAQPGQLRGRLQFDVLPSGALGNATFQVSDGTTFPVVGHAAGYALQARIALGEDRALILMGVGEQEIGACRGAIDGLMSGPQPGDLGDWQALGLEITNETGGGDTAPIAPTPVPSQVPEAPGCAPGLTRCDTNCVDVNLDDLHCGFCGNACGEGSFCGGGTCIDEDGCPAGAANCNGHCVDLGSDPANCGGCALWCAEDQVCSGGICVQANHQCKEDGQPCNGNEQCCSGYCSNGGAVCSTPVPACLEMGEPCLVNWDCCSGICNTYDYSYTCADLTD